MKYLFLFFLFPFFLSAEINQDFSEAFSKYMFEQDFDRCDEILFEWKLYNTLPHSSYEMLKACLCFARGEIEEGKRIFHKNIEAIPDSFLDFLINLIENDPPEFSEITEVCSFNGFTHLCKKTQPRRIKVVYWLGVTKIVAGCIAMPFNPTVGMNLIGAGITAVTVVSAEALDNKDEWEKNLNDRQKMTPNEINYRNFTINTDSQIIAA